MIEPSRTSDGWIYARDLKTLIGKGSESNDGKDPGAFGWNRAGVGMETARRRRWVRIMCLTKIQKRTERAGEPLLPAELRKEGPAVGAENQTEAVAGANVTAAMDTPQDPSHLLNDAFLDGSIGGMSGSEFERSLGWNERVRLGGLASLAGLRKR